MIIRKFIAFFFLWEFLIMLPAPATEQKEQELRAHPAHFMSTLVGYESQPQDFALLELSSQYRPSPYRLPTEEENAFVKLVASQYLEIAKEMTPHSTLKRIKDHRLQWLDCILRLASNPPLQYVYNLSEEMWKRKIIYPQEKYQIDMVESLIKLDIEISYLKEVLKKFEDLSGYDGVCDLGKYYHIADKSIEQQSIMTPKAECHSLIIEKIKENQSIVEGIKNHLKRIEILRLG